MNSVLTRFKKDYTARGIEEMSLSEYLDKAKTDPSMYANVYERLLTAIGKPKLIDTSKDERLGRIHGNRVIKVYEAFSEFYGIENVIERTVNFIKHAAQGLEEANQILYFKGPPGSAKSTLVAKLKELVEQQPLYVLKGSPIQESPLGLFSKNDAKDLNIPERYFKIRPSAIALQQLEEYKGDVSRFKVEKIYPSEAYQRGIGVIVASDENTQDVSDLVGKINIRALEDYPADDPRAYSFSGALCHGHNGMVEYIEMFKSAPKMLNPLLTATQDHFYQATEAIPAIPFLGMIVAHSNESEWQLFKANNINEGFLDRIYLLNVPYCVRETEEVEIYKKLIRQSELRDAPVSPGTLELLARFVIATRIEPNYNSDLMTKVHVYNGEHMKDKDPNSLSINEYRRAAEKPEGFDGISTRDAFKLLSEVYNTDLDEIAANPVYLFASLERFITEKPIKEDEQEAAQSFLNEHIKAEFYTLFSEDLQTAFLDSYDRRGQALFDRYFIHADQWLQNRDYRDPETNQILDRESLDNELSRLEKPAGIANPKSFRQEVVTFCIRYQSKHNGENPSWSSYNKIKDVIKKTMFEKTEDLIPLISFDSHSTEAEESEHKSFIKRMKEKGYTEKQVRLLVEWQQRFPKCKE